MTNHFIVISLTNTHPVFLNLNNITYAEQVVSAEHGNRKVTELHFVNTTETIFIEDNPTELYNRLVRLNTTELKEYNLPK